MAKMRMSPIALAHLIKFRENIDTIFHLTCRDRNVIGLQAELLGAAALGVHNILTLTGDKPSSGDHPDAKAVFEVDSQGLLTIAGLLNKGRDLAGNELDEPTDFYIGTTGNPGADDLDAEYDKLAHRVELGANFVQTQPIYDLEKAARFIEKVKPLGIPVMLGLIPLKSFKMANYLNDKVPGIFIPSPVLHAMEKGGRETGLKISRELVEGLKEIGAAGAHVMPVNDVDAVKYIAEGLR